MRPEFERKLASGGVRLNLGCRHLLGTNPRYKLPRTEKRTCKFGRVLLEQKLHLEPKIVDVTLS